jgi:UDP-glucuronate 4-epimerase
MHGTILITGANGYLGAACVARYARTAQREVVAVWHAACDRLSASPPAHVRYEQADLTDARAVDALIERSKPEVILHAAALLSDGAQNYMSRAVRANVLATANLCEAAARCAVARFVYCSSISVYGAASCPASGWDEDTAVRPASAYGASKHAGEECVRIQAEASTFSAVSLRLAGIHGRGRAGGVAYNMMRSAMSGEALIVSDPEHRFQLLFIEDAVQALALAAERPPAGAYQIVNVASHVFSSLRSMAESIVEACGSGSRIEVGTAGLGAGDVMNTARIGKLYEFEPDALERHMKALREFVPGSPRGGTV